MKRNTGTFAIFAYFVVMLFLASFVVVGYDTVAAEQDGDYTYSISGDPAVATITGYTGSGGNITTPSSLGGMEVIAIGDEAFEECNSLISVTISGSVTTIGKNAFSACANLTSIEISANVTSIGAGAFMFCYELTSIEVVASNSNYAGINGVLYDKTVSTLIQCPGGMAGGMVIPDTVTSIGPRAFNTCPFLTSVDIPSSVTEIGEFAFIQCSSLTSIDVDTANLNYASVDGVLYNKTITEALQCPGGKTGALVLPDSVTSIREWSFSYCPSITSMTIPGNVTSIGYGAFISCSSLTSITFSGLVAPTAVGTEWITGTGTGLLGHAYASSDFPAPGSSFYELTMGDVIPVVPTAPLSLTATPDDDDVQLSWATPSEDRGSAIINYSVYRSGTLGGNYTLISSVSGLNYTDIGVVKGQTYWYKVSAINANGEGELSLAIEVEVPEDDS
ncbi:MAG: fibronectin type III domain-containing protein [Methanomassiliicoccales archaeon]|jgi:hypothetical protein